MSGCCAYGCKNRSERQMPGITFHLFPRDPVRRKAWTLAVKRKNFCPTNFTRICSEHFAEECFNRRISNKKVRLLPNAVPTIFKTYPKSLQNISSLAPLTDFYSNNDIIVKREESDSDEVDEEDEVDEDEQEEDSMSDSSLPSLCGDPPETEVVYVSEEYDDDSDQPNLKIIPGPGQELPVKDVTKDKDLEDALSAYKKLMDSSNPADLKGKTVSVIFVHPPRDDELPPISPEANLKRQPGGLEYRVWMQTKKIKALNEQNERYLERIRELEKTIESYKNPQTTDEEEMSEDDISVNEIYDVLLKHQKEEGVAES